MKSGPELLKGTEIATELKGATSNLIKDFEQAQLSEIEAEKALNAARQSGKDTTYLQKTLDDAKEKTESLKNLVSTLDQKGPSGAYQLLKENPDLRSTPAAQKWLNSAKDFMDAAKWQKAKSVATGSLGLGIVGLGTAAGVIPSIIGWLHTNPPSVYAKEMNEAIEALNNLGNLDGKAGQIVDSLKTMLSNFSNLSSKGEQAIINNPEALQDFISNLTEVQQVVDKFLQVWEIVYNAAPDKEAATKAYKELKDVDLIIAGRLKTLGEDVGQPADISTNALNGPSNTTNKNQDTQTNDLAKIQNYLSNSYPRVKTTGELDPDTKAALEDIENRIYKVTGEDFTETLEKADYADFIKIINILKNNNIDI